MSIVTLYHKDSGGSRSFDSGMAEQLLRQGWVDSPDKLHETVQELQESFTENSTEPDTDNAVSVQSCPKCSKSFARGLTMHIKYCKAEG